MMRKNRDGDWFRSVQRKQRRKCVQFGSRLALGEVHRELDQRLALGNEILMDPPYTHRINPT